MGMKRVPVTAILSIAVGLGVWQIVATFFIDPYFLPSISSIFMGAVDLTKKGLLFRHIGFSLMRIFIGWLSGSLIAIPIGLIIGELPLFKQIIDPYIHFLRFIPAIALVTLFIVWFGVGEFSKVIMVTYATGFIVMINTASGVVSIHHDKKQAAQCLGASPRQIFFHIIIPATLPSIYLGMRLALASSFLVIVAVEMLAAEAGLGFLVWTSKLYFRIDWMFVGIFLLGTLGFLTDRGWRLFGNLVLKKYIRELGKY